MTDDRHQELRLLVQADIDGELTARDAAAIAVHLDGCAECRALQRALRRTKAQIRADATRHAAPENFRLRMADMIAADAPKPAAKRQWNWAGWLGSFGLGAAVAAALLLTIQVPHDSGTEEAVLDGHLRALQSGRLYDVASSDRHTVKPWFDGKVDFAPPVRDLAAQGFPLRGGRLDTVRGRAVAAMVYGRARHTIDLFVWRRPDASDTAPRDAVRNGYNLVAWSSGGMMFWAVSDLNRAELDAFVRDWQEAD
jgi:anti-sigma factor RsiW